MTGTESYRLRQSWQLWKEVHQNHIDLREYGYPSPSRRMLQHPRIPCWIRHHFHLIYNLLPDACSLWHRAAYRPIPDHSSRLHGHHRFSDDPIPHRYKTPTHHGFLHTHLWYLLSCREARSTSIHSPQRRYCRRSYVSMPYPHLPLS